MEEYSGNSKTGKVVRTEKAQPKKAPTEPSKPKVEKVVSGPVIQRKTPLGRRMKTLLIGGDAKDASRHVAEDVLLPAFRDMIMDAGSTMLERIIFPNQPGRARVARGLVNNASQSFVNYRSFGGNPTSTSIRPDPRQQDPRPQLSREARRNHDFREIILASRPEANEVLDRMQTLINQYDTCSVSDLYSMLDITADFPDEQWGWDNLEGAGVHRDGRSGGYMLILPKPEPL